MQLRLFREYQIKFYLNARHYIFINGVKGAPHPHTWEFSINIQFDRNGFIEFNTFEKAITEYLAPYQNSIMNEKEPFNTIVPTLENMADYFAQNFAQIISKIGGKVVKLEASETPTRRYILNLRELNWEEEHDKEFEAQMLSSVMDSVLDDIIR